jgi:hypothetical protein
MQIQKDAGYDKVNLKLLKLFYHILFKLTFPITAFNLHSRDFEIYLVANLIYLGISFWQNFKVP